MNVRAIGQKRLVIVGATGMVGGYALRYALEHAAIGRATSIGRRKLGISHPKLHEIVHQDFADCSALAPALSDQDAAVFCMGTYTGTVPDAQLRAITVDYTREFARVLRSSSPDAAFSFLSGSAPTPRDEAEWRLHVTREKQRMRSARRDSQVFTSSGPPTSTPWSRERNRILVTVSCD
jgi:uncharacterized protein YbjT (DUF2867 family)